MQMLTAKSDKNCTTNLNFLPDIGKVLVVFQNNTLDASCVGSPVLEMNENNSPDIARAQQLSL